MCCAQRAELCRMQLLMHEAGKLGCAYCLLPFDKKRLGKGRRLQLVNHS